MGSDKVVHFVGLWWYASVLQRFQTELLVVCPGSIHGKLVCISSDFPFLIVQRTRYPPRLMLQEGEYLIVMLPRLIRRFMSSVRVIKISCLFYIQRLKIKESSAYDRSRSCRSIYTVAVSK